MLEDKLVMVPSHLEGSLEGEFYVHLMDVSTKIAQVASDHNVKLDIPIIDVNAVQASPTYALMDIATFLAATQVARNTIMKKALPHLKNADDALGKEKSSAHAWVKIKGKKVLHELKISEYDTVDTLRAKNPLFGMTDEKGQQIIEGYRRDCKEVRDDQAKRAPIKRARLSMKDSLELTNRLSYAIDVVHQLRFTPRIVKPYADEPLRQMLRGTINVKEAKRQIYDAKPAAPQVANTQPTHVKKYSEIDIRIEYMTTRGVPLSDAKEVARLPTYKHTVAFLINLEATCRKNKLPREQFLAMINSNAHILRKDEKYLGDFVRSVNELFHFRNPSRDPSILPKNNPQIYSTIESLKRCTDAGKALQYN